MFVPFPPHYIHVDNHEQVFAQPPYPYPPVNDPAMALSNGNHGATGGTGGGSKRGGKKQKAAPSSGPEVYDTGKCDDFQEFISNIEFEE